jgi:hypothetical protein
MLVLDARTWSLDPIETAVSGSRGAPGPPEIAVSAHAVSGRAACRRVIGALPSLQALLTPHPATSDSARRLIQLPQGGAVLEGADEIDRRLRDFARR